MKYYIVDCISGCRDGARPITDLDKAREKRDKMNAKRAAEGGSDEFWLIVDKDGNEVI